MTAKELARRIEDVGLGCAACRSCGQICIGGGTRLHMCERCRGTGINPEALAAIREYGEQMRREGLREAVSHCEKVTRKHSSERWAASECADTIRAALESKS